MYPQIISEDLYDDVQAKLKMNHRKRDAKTLYICLETKLNVFIVAIQ